MLYLVWSLPALLVVGLIASGRAGILKAAMVGTTVALVVAFLTAPQTFRPAEAGLALARGAWIGWIVVPYILGGLFFWQLAVKAGSKSAPLERTGDGRANLAGTPGMERAAYRVMLPLAAVAMACLPTAAVLVSLRGG